MPFRTRLSVGVAVAMSVPVLLHLMVASAAAQPPPGGDLRLAPYLGGLDQPVGLVPHPSDARVHYVIEKSGRIRVADAGVLRPTPFLDLSAAVATAGEQGLLGLAFAPDYAESGRFFVNFTRAADGATVIARFARRDEDPWRADPASRHDLRFDTQPERRFISQPATNHNGGRIWFGPDGYLYIAMGDGGGGNDQFRQAQAPQSLLGKILRLDVDVPDVATAPIERQDEASRGYRVPPDNPFVDGIPVAARPEIWAFGVRNPWRVTVDPPALGGTGALLIADVGQGAREEISYEPAGQGGRNYGWPLFEGSLANAASPPGVVAAYQPLQAPMFEYPRSHGVSITGGHVYRGTLLGTAMSGRYVFGDLTNRLYSVGFTVAPGPFGDDVAVAEPAAVDHTALVAPLSGSLVSIDADLHGELFLVLLSGEIVRLTTTADGNGNGLPDDWEQVFALPALGADAGGPFGDPDGDGVINAEELRRGTHPAAGAVGWLAEGATGFFETRVSLLNDSDEQVAANLAFDTADGRAAGHPVTLPPRRVRTVSVASVPGLATAEFVTRIEAPWPIVAAREMTWPAPAAYGSHSEQAAARPATVWHFAEGATTAFELFYLLQNTSADTDAMVEIAWRVQGRGSDRRQYLVPARRRVTVWVNQEPGLDGTELGATVTSLNHVPLVVERAMYTRGQPAFTAGHDALGEPALSARWFFAEGATGAFFDTFLAVVNPHDQPLDVAAEVYLQDGSTAAAPKTFAVRVGAGERATVWLDRIVTSDGTRLDDQGGLAVALSAPRGFVAERAMWWPGDASAWHEAHVVAGFAGPGQSSWRAAGGAVHLTSDGSRPLRETYVLVANVGATAAPLELRLYFADREPEVAAVTVPARARLTLSLADLAPQAFTPNQDVPVGVRLDAFSPDAQLYVEQAVYGTPVGSPQWSLGAAHRAGR